MTKLVCQISLAALGGMAIFDKTPDWTTASLRMVLALTFSLSLVALVRKEMETIFDR